MAIPTDLDPYRHVQPASPIVIHQMNRMNAQADELTYLATEAITGLQSLSFSNVDLDPRLVFTDGELQSMLDQLGEIPGAGDNDWLLGLDLSAGSQDFVFNPALLARLNEAAPGFLIPALPTAPALPEEPADPGDQGVIPAPTRPLLPAYDAPEVDLDIPVPEFTDYTSEVPFPTLREITLPTPPTLIIDEITFDGVRPSFEGTVPDVTEFAFTNETYEGSVVEEVKAAILNLLNGGNGLTPEVEDAIFERAREREMELSHRELEQVIGSEAAKGWRVPTGAMARRTDRLRMDARYKVSALNRDQFIEHLKIQIEQFRQGITAGIALEESLMRLFAGGEDRRFQAARLRMDMALAVFNAYVAKLNAESSMYSVDAQIYRDRLEGERTKLSVYAEELRAKQIIGELNAQDVAIFGERLKALSINAEIYTARVQGYSERYRAIEAQVSVYKTQLESNTQLVSVYEADTRVFGELVRAQQSREERFRIKGEIYSKKIDAWATQYRGLLDEYGAKVEGEKLKLGAFEADSSRLQAFIAGESGRIQALVQKYQAMATEIGAKSEVEKARYQLLLSIAQAQIERVKAAAEILLKNGEINIQSGLSAANLQLRALETAAQTLAQMAAGFTSAASVNASVGDRSDTSLSYTFSGDLDPIG